MELLEDAQVNNNVSKMVPLYHNMVKEFIVNLPKGINDAGRSLGSFM